MTGVALVSFILLAVPEAAVQVQLLVWIFVMRVMMIIASGVSYIGNEMVMKGKYGNAARFDFEAPLTSLVWVTSIVSLVFTFIVSKLLIGNIAIGGTVYANLWWQLSLIITFGTLAGAIIPEVVKVFTSTNSGHVREVVTASREGGASLNILAGLTDAFAGKPSRVGQEEMSASFKVIREIMQAEAAAKAEAAAGEGLAFLAENAKRDGITTLASGLQFEVLTAGEGAKPSREDTVRTHYHGTLIDGTVFDSSYERGQPAEFPVGGVIAGWTEALQLMNAGSKWRLYVPSELAYGAQGVGSIPPHSVLVFDVELLDVL